MNPELLKLLQEFDQLVANILECMRTRHALFSDLAKCMRTTIFDRKSLPHIDNYLERMSLLKQEMRASMNSFEVLLESYPMLKNLWESKDLDLEMKLRNAAKKTIKKTPKKSLNKHKPKKKPKGKKDEDKK